MINSSRKLNCRLCGYQHPLQAFKSPGSHGHHRFSSLYQIYYCPACRSYFLGPVEQQSNYFKKAYGRDYYPKMSFLSQKIVHLSHFLKRQILNLPDNSKILDVGCGRGEFLDSLPNRFLTFGLDPQNAVTISPRHHFYHGNFETVKLPPKYYDAITFWHSLEHLPHPQLAVNKAYSCLKKGGILIINTPNADSLGFRFGKDRYFHLDAPRHLFLPSQTSLALLLQKSGFINLSYRNPWYDFPLDLFWSVAKHPLRFLIYPLYPLFKLLSRETIIIIGQKA